MPIGHTSAKQGLQLPVGFKWGGVFLAANRSLPRVTSVDALGGIIDRQHGADE